MCYFNTFYSYNNFDVVISIIIVLSCVFTCLQSTHYMCKLNSCITTKSTIMISMFPRAVSLICMLSQLTVIYKNLNASVKYEKNIKRYEMYYPMDIYKANFRIFVIITVSLCGILILPVNGLRIYLLYDQFRDNAMVLFFSIMYLQNISLCITELQFIAYCFGLYLKYRSINEDLAILKSRTITINRYPSALNPGKYNSICNSSGSNYNICQTIKECQLVNSIESLRMRHRFVSDSVNDLNDIYSIQLGLSLFILLIMALFDIYEVVLTEYNLFQTYEMLLMWLSQYAFRFSMIVLTTHFTTKQVIIINS